MAVRDAINDAFEILVLILCHLVVATCLIAASWTVGYLLRWFWGQDHPLLFDYVPFSYILDGLDILIIALVARRGVHQIISL